MSEGPRPPKAPNRVGGARNTVVGAILGGGAIVMLGELGKQSALLAGVAVVAGFALLALLPRPIDLRSGVYAFFVPIAMSYGAATSQYALLVAGVAVGVLFIAEKTSARRAS